MERLPIRGAGAPRSEESGGLMRTFYAVSAMLVVIGASLFLEAQKSTTAWRVLFDGTSLDAWRGYKTDKVPSGWHIADGSLVKDEPVGDIVSKEEFGYFELEIES